MTQTVKVTQYQYLKTPKWKWTITNDVGGSFSNSGEYRTLTACLRALRQGTGRNLPLDTKIVITFIRFNEDFDFVETSVESTLGKELPVECK